MTSPFAFYQYWLNIEDASVGQLLPGSSPIGRPRRSSRSSWRFRERPQGARGAADPRHGRDQRWCTGPPRPTPPPRRAAHCSVGVILASLDEHPPARGPAGGRSASDQRRTAVRSRRVCSRRHRAGPLARPRRAGQWPRVAPISTMCWITDPDHPRPISRICCTASTSLSAGARRPWPAIRIVGLTRPGPRLSRCPPRVVVDLAGIAPVDPGSGTRSSRSYR